VVGKIGWGGGEDGIIGVGVNAKHIVVQIETRYAIDRLQVGKQES
jgi:hypothetical protein